LKLHSLRNNSHLLEAQIYISDCRCPNRSTFLSGYFRFSRVPTRKLKKTFQFSLPAVYCKNLTSAECARSAYIDYRDDAAFREQIFTLKSDFKRAFVFLFLSTNELPDDELNCILAYKPFKAYWKLEASTGLTFKNCTFCTYCTCFVFITEQRGIFAVHNKLNGFYNQGEKCFLRGTHCVLNKTFYASSLKG